jgi:hypothetical protein
LVLRSREKRTSSISLPPIRRYQTRVTFRLDCDLHTLLTRGGPRRFNEQRRIHLSLDESDHGIALPSLLRCSVLL